MEEDSQEAAAMDIPCTRSGFLDSCSVTFGALMRGIECNPDPDNTFDIDEISSAWTAAVVQLAPYLNAMGYMINPMMNPIMMNPMMQMLNGNMMGNIGSARQNRSAISGPPKSYTSQAKLSSITNGAGTRQFSSRNGADGGEASDTNANNQDQDGVAVAIGPCVTCSTSSSNTCGRCGAFYCSRECQKKNWPDHQNMCNSGMPPLNYTGIRGVVIVQSDTEHGRFSPVVNSSVPSNIQHAAGNRMRSPQFEFRSEQSMNGRDNRSGRDERNGTGYRDGRNSNQMGLRPAEHQGSSPGRSSRSPGSMGQHVPLRKPYSVPYQLTAKAEKPTATPVQSESPKRRVMSRLMQNLPSTSATPVSPRARAGTPPTSPPNVRTEIPSCVKISSGDPVSISHFEKNSVYLQSTSPQNLKQMVKMSRDLTDYCAKAEPLKRAPNIQEFLAVKDSPCFYRAVVIRQLYTKSETLYDVLLVDYGTIDKGVPISRMVSLSNSLAKVPIMSCKTTLNKVPNNELSSEAKVLLNRYFVGEKRLKVKFSGRFEDGVTLLDCRTGESLNEMILKALGSGDSVAATPTISPLVVPTGIRRLLTTRSPLIPTPTPVVAAPTPAPVVVPAAAPTPAPVVPTTAQSAPRQFYLNQIDRVKFPIRGTKLDVVVHCIMEERGRCTLMASPGDLAALAAVINLNNGFAAYAATVQPYIPDVNELCIAKWTDHCWYRAACISRDGGKVTVIFFDYGNVDSIPVADIRPFKKEFMSVPALSAVCVLSGPELTNAQTAKLKSMQKDLWILSATVVEISCEGALVKLDIPEIRQKL